MNTNTTPKTKGLLPRLRHMTWWKKLVLSLFIIVAGVAMALVVCRWKLMYDIKLIKVQIAAQGYPVTLEEWDKFHKTRKVPENENGIKAIYDAASGYQSVEDLITRQMTREKKNSRQGGQDSFQEEDYKSHPLYKNLPSFGYNYKLLAGQPLPQEVQKAIQFFLSENRGCLVKVCKILDYNRFYEPFCFYPAEKLSITEFPILNHQRNLTRLCFLQAISEAQNNRPDETLKYIRILEKLASSNDSQPILIHKLLAIAMHRYIYDCKFICPSLRNYSVEDLKALRETGNISIGLSQLPETMMVESLIYGHVYEDITAFSKQCNLPENDPALLIFHYGVDGLRMAKINIETSLRLITHYNKPVSPAYCNLKRYFDDRIKQEEAILASESDTTSSFRKYTRYLSYENIQNVDITGMKRFTVEYFTTANVFASLASTYIACLIHDKLYDRLPETLEELKEKGIISELPNDLFSGKPLRYERKGKQAKLYSVGRNGKDDKGDLNSARSNPLIPDHKAPDIGIEFSALPVMQSK